MFREIPLIIRAEEIIDKAIKKSKKVRITDRDPFYRKKKTIVAKVESFSKNIIQTLEGYIKKFPSIDRLPLFYQQLINIQTDIDKVKKSLGAVNWARKICQTIYNKQITSLRKSNQITFLQQKHREIIGRISSVLKQIDTDLELLIEAQSFLRRLPDIKDRPTIVIAGYPNVGKSSILRCLSNAKPKIAQYPFTTKEIHVGHISKKDGYSDTIFQIIDTPGLLDKPLSKRNKIEQHALAALRYLADIILFVFDPSETSGYSMNDQKNLLNQIKKMFPECNFIIVNNKADIKTIDKSYHNISCKTSEGIQNLKEMILDSYKSK